MIGFLACSGSDGPGYGKIERIILVSIDTLRADALHSYGNPEEATATMDRLAAQGIRFVNAIAPAPMTLPSHATLLTGLHPLQHGIVVNGLDALPENVETLAEILSDEGWNTGAVVSSSVLRRRWGLERGFETYRDDLFSWMRDSGTFVEGVSADRTTEAAMEWIQAQPRDVPLFLFVHYIDPHSPYTAPSPYARRFPEDPYLAEVAFVDSQLGRLVEFMEGEDLLEGTLWIVTSDHGEGLGDHGVNSHGTFLYEEATRVPLIFSGAGVPAGRVVDSPAGLIDIVPTVLGLLGIGGRQSLPGLDLTGEVPSDRALVSVSYVPALVYDWSPLWSLRTANERFVLAPEREYYRLDDDPGELENRALESSLRADELETALRDRAARYFATYEPSESLRMDEAQTRELLALGYIAPALELSESDYDDFSGADPKEMLDVVTTIEELHRARSGKDFDRAMRLLDDARSRDPANPVLDALESLLLLEAERYDDLLDWYASKPPALQDQNIHRYRRAVALRNVDRPTEAIELLFLAVAEDPEAASNRYELATQLLVAGRLEEAVPHFEQILARDPRNIDARLNLANALARLGRDAEALEELEILQVEDMNNPSVYNNLGIVYAKLGRYAEASSMLIRFQMLTDDPSARARAETMIRKLRRLRAGQKSGVDLGADSGLYPPDPRGRE